MSWNFNLNDTYDSIGDLIEFKNASIKAIDEHQKKYGALEEKLEVELDDNLDKVADEIVRKAEPRKHREEFNRSRRTRVFIITALVYTVLFLTLLIPLSEPSMGVTIIGFLVWSLSIPSLWLWVMCKSDSTVIKWVLGILSFGSPGFIWFFLCVFLYRCVLSRDYYKEQLEKNIDILTASPEYKKKMEQAILADEKATNRLHKEAETKIKQLKEHKDKYEMLYEKWMEQVVLFKESAKRYDAGQRYIDSHSDNEIMSKLIWYLTHPEVANFDGLKRKVYESIMVHCRFYAEDEWADFKFFKH